MKLNMKTHRRKSFLLPVLIVVISLLPIGWLSAQTFTTLHSFSATSDSYPYPNSDGANPWAGLALSGNTLYGTTRSGGSYGNGTAFALKNDGTSFTNLHSFLATSGSYPPTNNGGANPNAALALSGNVLYGTTYGGGIGGAGTVFAINADGSGFTNLHNFAALSGYYTNSDGVFPIAELVISGNTLYGTAQFGGSSGNGTVFAVKTDGTGFTNLHVFSATSDSPSSTNSDGAYPVAGLILSGDTLYGTANIGGIYGKGTVFAVKTDGTGFTNLHSFSSATDGANPSARLELSGNTLYGTTYRGGSFDAGTVFALNVASTEFTNLYNFTAPSASFPYTNSDGGYPRAGLILSGNILYGTAYYGGSYGKGTAFALNSDGTGFTNLHNFDGSSDGANPQNLIISGNNLYGTTLQGNATGHGTVFSISLPPASAPQLNIIPSGENVIVTWPAEPAGYNLQSAPTITGTFTNIPGATSPYTNLVAEPQRFFRLSQ